jgi:voltage-gated potassium channel
MEIFNKYIFRLLLLGVFLLLLTGTIFYHLIEKFSWLDAYYFSVVTLATVGYGDLVPHTPAGKIFTTIYIFLGVGTLAAFLSAMTRRRGAKIRERHPKINAGLAPGKED